MRKIFIFLFFLYVCVYGKSVNGLNQSFDKEIAIQNAHWKAFESILDDLIGQNAYKGSIKKSFKKDLNKDFIQFKEEYFDFSTYKCQNKGDDGFLCYVRGNINLKKIRAILSEKSNQTTTMGKHQMSNLKIVLIDSISNEDSKNFISYLQADLNNSGHSFSVIHKEEQVGRKGNHCKKIEAKLNIYIKKKSNSYKSAIAALRKRVEECKENENIEYAFLLDKLVLKEYNLSKKTNLRGTLTYRIIMFNTKSGKKDQSIKPQIVTAFAMDKDNLVFKLYEKASILASSHITSNLLNYIGKKKETSSKKTKKLNSFEYQYTVILMNITNDGSSRGKRKLVRDVIKELKAKPIKNSSESSDFEQVYNFGTHEELDLEDFADKLYDLSDSVGIPIQISDDGNSILNIQFQ